MKARLSLICLLCLCLGTPAAHAAPAPLSGPELLAWRDGLWAALLETPVVNDPAATNDPDGADTWLFAFGFGVAELTEPALDSDENPIASVEIDTSAVPCPRGLAVGDTLEAVLAAYPNENPALQGDGDYAALYLYPAQADGDAAWGWLARQNRTVWSVVYTVSTPAPGMQGFRQEYSLAYIIDDGHVAGIRAEGFDTLLTDAESLANAEAVAVIAQGDGYEAALPASGAAFSAGDLTVMDMDFGAIAPEDVQARLGDPLGDSTDALAGIRTITYPDLLLEFTQTADGWQLDAAAVSAGSKSGPRGLRIGDTRASVVAQFGDSEDDEENMLFYTCEDAQGNRYALACQIAEGLVSEYILYRI